MRSKRKNKAIAGRRNRCHALGPIFKAIYEPLDEVAQAEMKRAIQLYMEGGRSSYMLIHSPDIEVINPNTFKKPRFLS